MNNFETRSGPRSVDYSGQYDYAESIMVRFWRQEMLHAYLFTHLVHMLIVKLRQYVWS